MSGLDHESKAQDSAGHTPGPWKATGAGVDACMVSETLTSGRRVARRVATAKGISIEEVRANARLIAAAPDMLAALKAIVWEATPDARERARAAIAKAEGR